MVTNKDFKILGRKVRGSISADKLETFLAPDGLQRVTMIADEVTALCPVTGQPDQYEVTIIYEPNGLCLESKSLKLYLQRFRNAGIFVEALSCLIAKEIGLRLATNVDTAIVQKSRGGISIIAEGSNKD